MTLAVTAAAAGAAAGGGAWAGATAPSEAATARRAEGPAAVAVATAVVPGATAAPPVPVPRAGAAPGGAAGQEGSCEAPGTPFTHTPIQLQSSVLLRDPEIGLGVTPLPASSFPAEIAPAAPWPHLV